MKKLAKPIVSFIILSMFACAPQSLKIELQTGDLLFRGESGGQLSEAIDKVTQTSDETHFSHVGLVKILNDEIFILHASPEGGICKISLNDFLHPQGDSVVVVAYRLKEQCQHTIPIAIEQAEKMLSLPYNFSYVLNDSSYYCSEFVFRAFANDSVFTLNPMTFKDPLTNDFFPTWIDYYQKLGIEIPEGLPGCNPNGMATSEKLIKLGILKQ